MPTQPDESNDRTPLPRRPNDRREGQGRPEWIDELVSALALHSGLVHPKRPRFDGVVNLGHVLQAVVIIAGFWIFFTKSEVRTAQLESRILYVEGAQKEIRDAMARMTDGQNAIARAQERMSTSLEYLAKGANQPATR